MGRTPTVHGVTKSQTQPSDFTFTFMVSCILIKTDAFLGPVSRRLISRNEEGSGSSALPFRC